MENNRELLYSVIFVLIFSIATIPSSFAQDNGESSDYTPPILGYDRYGNKFVTDGFTYNGLSVDVQFFFTPYPLFPAYVGVPNNAEFKIYDEYGPDNISHFEFAFGLKKGQLISQTQVAIEWDRDFAGEETIGILDPDNVLSDVAVVVTEDMCGEENDLRCLVISIDHTFRESLSDYIVATNVWDKKRNSSQNYYNHGIYIIGDSLNPPDTVRVGFGTKDMRGMYELTQIDPISDTWIDEFENIYQNHGNNKFVEISSVKQNTIDDDSPSMNGYDRMDASFSMIKQTQADIASDMMKPYYRTSINSDERFSEINDIVSIDYKERYDKTKDILIHEMHRAEDVLKQACPECNEPFYTELYDIVLWEGIDAMLEEAKISDTSKLDDPLIQEIMQQEYDDAVNKFNQRYGYIHNQDFDIIESIEMINDDTSSDVNIKELSQIEISKALEIFKQYGTVYSQD